MKSLREYIAEAEKDKKALGHFNVSNLEGVWAIARAGKDVGVPVVIGVSEGERDFVGVKQIKALVDSVREELDHPIFLNADHTYSLEKIKEAVDAQFDSVIVDGAKLSFEDNVKLTSQAVQYARSKNQNILVEGELGFIGQSSKILDSVPEGVDFSPENLTSPEDAKKFVEETGVDLLAPAVGNMHGMIMGAQMSLDADRIKAIRESSGVPLVLHGGSGNTNEDFVRAIESGISTVHINTELRLVFRDTLKRTLQEDPEEVAPYKIMKPSLLAMQKLVEDKLKLFSRIS